MNRALFLDRDAIVNLDDGDSRRVEQLRFVPGLCDPETADRDEGAFDAVLDSVDAALALFAARRPSRAQ
jgi:histidinol phosphatase-like enzyme